MITITWASGVYRFCADDDISTALKVDYDFTSSIEAAAAAGTVVKTASKNGFRSELWYWNGSNLLTEYGRTYDNRYLKKNSSGKAEISATSATVTLEQVHSDDYEGRKCKIKIGTYYLVSDSDQCTFTQTASDGTIWRAERIRRMTNMPANAGYPERVEYFHPDVFSSDGAWRSSITTKVKAFYNKVFGGGATNANCMYNLYGALMTSGSDIGKFHQGVDMHANNGDAIKSAHAGTATVKPIAGGQVAFKDLSPKRIYLHLATSVNNPVEVGEEIGTQQSRYGHLHFEVNTKGTAQSAVADSSSVMNARKPYNYM